MEFSGFSFPKSFHFSLGTVHYKEELEKDGSPRTSGLSTQQTDSSAFLSPRPRPEARRPWGLCRRVRPSGRKP